MLGLGSVVQCLLEGCDGCCEQDLVDWLEVMVSVVCMVLEEVVVDGCEVCVLVVFVQQYGLFLFDVEGWVLCLVKFWCDIESVVENCELLEVFGGLVGLLECLGLVFVLGYMLFKLFWSRCCFFELFVCVVYIFLFYDYFNYWFIGCVCSEVGDVFGSGYFDVCWCIWVSDVLELVELGGCLVVVLLELIEFGVCIGNLCFEVVVVFGLVFYMWVVCGGGDNMFVVIGIGNICYGLFIVSLGIFGILSVYVEWLLVSLYGELVIFCVLFGGWLLLVCMMNFIGVCGLVQDLLYFDFDEFFWLVVQVLVGVEGLLMLLFFDGEWVLVLLYVSVSLYGMIVVNLSCVNFCWVVFEGIVFGLCYGFDLLCVSGLLGEEICLVGGVVKNLLWWWMFVDLFGLLLVCLWQIEVVVFGVVFQVVWSLGCESGVGESLEVLCWCCVVFDELICIQFQV